MARTGLWMIGARGGVAVTATVGMLAMRRGLVGPTGLMTMRAPLCELDLVAWDDILVAGHDIRAGSLVDEARALAEKSRAFDPALVTACTGELERIDAAIVPGTTRGCGGRIEALAAAEHCTSAATPRAAIESIREDWTRFADRHGLERLVVVNVASTEPPFEGGSVPDLWDELQRRLDQPGCGLPASTLYAIAAFESGWPYINFTPSTGASLPAVAELARRQGVCHAGRDGKTGETLLKSTLAPMFLARNLEILSWVGHNILGNRDGAVLHDPANKASKVAGKDQLLAKILGYAPQSHVSIEAIGSLGDWKTAWDHIHFAGFLGTPMTMQFTWQGCDSVLAAPLVLDLFRLVDFAARQGESGPLPWLASWFKSPEGTAEHDFFRQIGMLHEWVQRHLLPRNEGAGAAAPAWTG